MSTVSEILKSKDPLADENLSILIFHAEEDNLVDYKEDFDFSSEKAWLGITKDILAFYNTHGGYLVFGVKDSTFELTGLEFEVVKILADPIKILQKINRFIDPEITNIRSKKFSTEEKNFVVTYIPSSKNLTCMIKRDGKYKYPSGDEKYEFRMGTTYLRRSAGNHLADSRDLDFLFNKRLANYRTSILSNLARVIEAPSESEVLIVSQDTESRDANRFVIDDSSDAIPVKGMSFTVEPKTDEHEIASSISLNIRNPLSIPPTKTLWKWYKKKESLVLADSQKRGLVKFCIIRGVPCFFWLQESNVEEIKQILSDTLKFEGSADYYGRVLIVANFLGVGPFKQILKKLGTKALRISQSKKRYVKDDVFTIVNMGKLSNRKMKTSRETDSEYRESISNELTSIVDNMVISNPRVPNSIASDDAFAYDCYLYARMDKYRG